MRVLVVDDNTQNLYLLRTLLTGCGWDVEEAQHGAEALLKARQNPPDLVIADLLMPVMDGFTLLRHWKADERLRTVPFVVYTATYTDPEDETLALELGADAFIIKPAEVEPFLARLQEVLQLAARKALPVSCPAPLEPTPQQERYAGTLIRKLEQKRGELEQANRELVAAQEQLLRVLEVLPAAAYTCDAQGLLTYYNPHARALWGREPRLGDPADRFCASVRLFHPDGTPIAPADSWIATCLREGRVVHGGLILLERPDGSRRSVLAHAAPFLDPAGRVLGAVNVLEDITETLELSDALRQSEERFRRLAETTSTAIFVYSGEHFLYVNPATCAITGRWSTELLAMRFWEVVHPEHRELVRQRGLARQRGEAVPARYEFKILHKDGTERWIDFTAGRITWEGRPAAIGTAFDITDRKRAEEELRHSQYLLSESQRMAHVGSWELDLLANRLTWSDEVYRIFGIGPGEFGGTYEAFLECVHPEDRAAVDAAYMGSIREGKDTYEIEHRLIRRSTGEIRYVQERCEHIRDAAGRIVRSIGMVQDITERKRAETHIARLNRTYAVLSEINQLIVRERHLPPLLEGACRIAVETGGFRMAWIALAEPPHKSMRVVATAGADASTRLALDRVLEDPACGCHLPGRVLATGRHAVCNNVADDPETASWRQEALARGHLSVAVFPISVAGELHGLFSLYAGVEGFFDAEEIQLLNELAQDLGFAVETIAREQARQEAEARLAASEERFRQLAETVEDFFWVKDRRTHRFVYVSPAYERIWGRSCESLLQDPYSWLEQVHPDDRERVRQVSLAAPQENPFDMEYRIVRPDGQTRWVRSRVYPLRTPAGAPERVVGVTRDITRERQLEEQLRQSQKMEAIGRLAGGVAHDFNNILTAILMQTELLTDLEDLPSPVREGLQQIHAAAERAANLTRQLLLFSRREVMQPRLLDLNEAVTSMVRMLQRIIGEDIRLQLVLHSKPLWLRADPGMLDQVLMNLTVNARDAMPRGGQLLIQTAETQVEELRPGLPPEVGPGRYAQLRVQDTGCGIPPEILAHIFEPFFTTKEPGKGTGLGLATVYGIVQQHRGWIEVHSTPGQGTTFDIYLPIPVALESAETAPHRAKPRAGSETILLVEDDERLRQLTRSALERHGYRVWEAPDSAEALRLWPQLVGSVQLLVTDLVMPGPMNGRELARQFQQTQPDLKVILFSGYSQDLAGRTLELGPGQAFLAKPFTPEQLLHLVKQVLDQG